MDINQIRTVLTVLVFLVFAGIVWWAYGSKRKHRFDAAARSVLEDERSAPHDAAPGTKGKRQ
jgi:cytochrome c oxidase cbb3-type subunit 4